MKTVLELHNGGRIIVYDPENPPMPATPGQPRTGYLLSCVGRYEELTNTIWFNIFDKPMAIPLGFKPEVRDKRDE